MISVLRDDRRLLLFLGLLTTHTALLISANAAGAKMISIGGDLAASATVVAYIFSLVVMNCAAHIFGRELGRLIINFGLGAMVISVAFLELALHLPAASFWNDQAAFETVLGSAPRILAGGWLAYLVGQNLDLLIFLNLKRFLPADHWIPARSFISSALSQLVDSAVFMTVAFAGAFDLLPAILGQYAVKMAVTAVGAPFVYVAVKVVKQRLGG